MLVLSLSTDGPGLIDEHEALGIELLLAHQEALPLGRYVRPVLPGGGDDFFKGDLLLGEKAPIRAIAGVDKARGKLAPYVEYLLKNYGRDNPGRIFTEGVPSFKPE